MAVQRIQARMYGGAGRRPRRGVFWALALLGFAALAYAADAVVTGSRQQPLPVTPGAFDADQAKRHQLAENPRAARTPQKPAPATHQASPFVQKAPSDVKSPSELKAPFAPQAPSDVQLAVAREPMPAVKSPAVVKLRSAPEVGRNSQKGVVSAANAVPAETARASWPAVARAMDAGDYGEAERVLTLMTRASDTATRHNASIGLAQLAARRGDCSRVREIALVVKASGTADPAVKERARRLLDQCHKPSP